jgi:hypothetical protein
MTMTKQRFDRLEDYLRSFSGGIPGLARAIGRPPPSVYKVAIAEHVRPPFDALRAIVAAFRKSPPPGVELLTVAEVLALWLERYGRRLQDRERVWRSAMVVKR